MSGRPEEDGETGPEVDPDVDFDFAEPVLGFRIWALDDDGHLRGAAFDQLWTPGENVAVCRAGKPHPTAPVAGCRCGFNALHARPPKAYQYGPGYVAGAIAAWGEIEWHRTGFRAERACVLGLCWDDFTSEARKRTIERAAKRYGVEVVPQERIVSHAGQFAHSLAPATPPPPKLPRQDAPVAEADPLSTGRPGARGYWIGRHVLVERRSRELSIGLAPALAHRIRRDARIVSVAAGERVAEGDAVAVLYTPSGSFSIDAPHAGTVLVANSDVLRDPLLAAADLSEGGWVVTLRMRSHAVPEASPLIWGRRGREGYERFVARVGPDRMLDEVRLSRHLACKRVTCAEDAVSLMRERLRREAARANARLVAA